jgi:putative SOS response-associated peptidase YedK
MKPNWQLRIGDFLAKTTSYQKELAELERKLHIESWEQTLDVVELPTYYHANAFDKPQLIIIIPEGMFPAGWSLLPHKAKEDFKANTANARLEEADTTYSYKDVLLSKRAILPASSIFEYQKIYPTSGKKKDIVIIPYRIYNPDDFLSIGVIWDVWKPMNPVLAADKKNWKFTFAMVTKPANPLMAQIHNDGERMPLFLNREDEELWLNPKAPLEEVKSFLTKPYNGKLLAHTISTDINNTKNKGTNKPYILDPVKYDIPKLIYEN